MKQVIEKKEIEASTYKEQYYYDPNIIDKKFKLPLKDKDFKGNSLAFLYEFSSLILFFAGSNRFREISSILFSFIWKVRKRKDEGPGLLFDAFLKLGSTFIKVGQFLSSRGDLLPVDYIEELSKLQDSLPPLSFNQVKFLLEKELGKTIESVFKDFEKEPIASASIGQVHKAELLNGCKVVVKVQRPDLENLFYDDLAILKCLAVFLERYTEIGKDREWPEIIDEIGKTLFEEVDFIQEGKNADKLRKNLKHEDKIYIPKIFWKYTTRKAITIEYVPGVKITDVSGLKEYNLDPKELAVILVNGYFKQVFEDGFYHADPHPGNIVVKEDGTIVFYDFGMVGKLQKNVKDELLGVLFNILTNDTEALLSALKKLRLLKDDADVVPLKRVIDEALYKYYEGTSFENLNLGNIEDDLKKLFDEKPFRLPSKFAYTLRATTTLEGVCRTLDPNFSLTEVARKYFHSWLSDISFESKWNYLKSIFPSQSTLIEKFKTYFEVIKDLPRYVTLLEKDHKEEMIYAPILQKENELAHILKQENESLKLKVKDSENRLNVSYTVMLLLCFVFIGNYLAQSNNYAFSLFGFFVLCMSLASSISIVGWAIFKKRA